MTQDNTVTNDANTQDTATQDENDLNVALEQAQENSQKKEDNALEQEIKRLQAELQESQEIAKKAQHDYITLKRDFDGYVKRMETNAETQKEENLFTVVKKFLPFVESLRKSIEIIPEDKKEDPMVKGVILTYNKFLQTLEGMKIFPIESIGMIPDNELHEPVSMAPTDNPDLKGKVIQEFERGFYYQKGDEKKVITTSKVVIGQ